jgi:hypothetical protein
VHLPGPEVVEVREERRVGAQGPRQVLHQHLEQNERRKR